MERIIQLSIDGYSITKYIKNGYDEKRAEMILNNNDKQDE
jgi:hypothetical protein